MHARKELVQIKCFYFDEKAKNIIITTQSLVSN